MPTLFTQAGLNKLGRILHKARGDHSYRDFERITGVSHNTLRKLELAQVKQPDIATLGKLAPQTPFTLEELVEICQGRRNDAPQLEDIWPLVERMSNEEITRLQQRLDEVYVQMPLYNVHPSAGSGSVSTEEQIEDYIPFKKSWILNKLKVSPANLHLVRVKGESMEPSLRSGDLVMVNPDIEQVKDSIYVISLEDTILVKRLQKLPNKRLNIVSEHPAYHSFIVDPREPSTRFHLIGEVIWSSREW